MKNAPVLHRIEYLAFLAFWFVVRLVPHSTARSIGRILGRMLFTCLKSRRLVALNNLEHALPEVSPSERRILAKRSFAGMACTFTDAISAARFDAIEICSRLQFEGWENLENAESRGQGTIILASHFGAWELIALVIAIYKGPMTIVGRPLDNPFLDRHVALIRSRYGNSLVGKRGAARGMLRVLKAKGRTGILIDQRVQSKEGIPIPFFGRPASTSPLVARLSLKTGAPVVPVFVFPEPGGLYRVRVLPPILPDDHCNNSVHELTCQYIKSLEDVVREDPGQWLWMHNRWK